MARKPLSYEEFIALGNEYYNKGGDVIVECWDRNAFDTYVSEFGPVYKTGALKMIRGYYEEEREAAANSWW